MTSQRDPYQILGVAREASTTEIRRAYNAIAKQHHPDRNPGNVESLERFVEATAAYETLSDPAQRASLDAERRRTVQGPEFDVWDAPVSDIFSAPPESTPEQRYASLGEDPWSEPPYGAIAAALALVGIAALVVATFLFV